MEEVDKILQEYLNWKNFGKKSFSCPGEVSVKMVNFFKKNKKLPKPCDKCYKAIIFWGRRYTKENERKFLQMIKSFDENELLGKYDSNVVVFYFETKEEVMRFLSTLERKMKKFKVEGIRQWRKACKEYQNKVPEYWKNAKELI